MLKVVVVKIEEDLSWDRVQKFISLVSKERLDRCNKYIDEYKKITSILTELLIRKQLESTQTISMRYNEYGKPYLEQFEGIYFSVSHSGRYIAYVQDDAEIGIDIEEIKKVKHNIAKRFFADREAKYVENSDDKDNATLEIWTRKEAYLKKIGTGFQNGGFKKDVMEDKISQCIYTCNRKDYIVSVCTEDIIKNKEVMIEEISSEKLLKEFESLY